MNKNRHIINLHFYEKMDILQMVVFLKITQKMTIYPNIHISKLNTHMFATKHPHCVHNIENVTFIIHIFGNSYISTLFLQLSNCKLVYFWGFKIIVHIANVHIYKKIKLMGIHKSAYSIYPFLQIDIFFANGYILVYIPKKNQWV